VTRRIFDLGINPDWWKLEPSDQAETWSAITTEISARDPYCRGIVILGLEAPAAELLRSFEVAQQFQLVKGFAIGRTIFGQTADAWLAGDLDNAGAMTAMRENFSNLVERWIEMKAGDTPS